MAASKHKKFTLYISHNPTPILWSEITKLASAVTKELGARGCSLAAISGMWDGDIEAVSTITVIAEASERNVLMVSAIMEAFGEAMKQEQVLYTIEEIEACFVDILPRTQSY